MSVFLFDVFSERSSAGWTKSILLSPLINEFKRTALKDIAKQNPIHKKTPQFPEEFFQFIIMRTFYSKAKVTLTFVIISNSPTANVSL